MGSVTGFGQSIASFARMITPMVAGAAQGASLQGPGLAGAFSAGVGAGFAGWVSRKAKLKKM